LPKNQGVIHIFSLWAENSANKIILSRLHGAPTFRAPNSWTPKAEEHQINPDQYTQQSCPICFGKHSRNVLTESTYTYDPKTRPEFNTILATIHHPKNSVWGGTTNEGRQQTRLKTPPPRAHPLIWDSIRITKQAQP